MRAGTISTLVTGVGGAEGASLLGVEPPGSIRVSGMLDGALDMGLSCESCEL